MKQTPQLHYLYSKIGPYAYKEISTHNSLANLNLMIESLGTEKLYKYVQKEHVNPIIQSGTFRISTLGECRRTEESNLVGDSKEGIKPFSEYVSQWTSSTGPELSDQVRGCINLEGPNNQIRNCSIAGVIQSPDRYLMCLSKRCSRELMQDFQYSACIEISNLAYFFRNLALEPRIQLRADFFGISPIFYFDEDQHDIEYALINKLHPMQVKRLRYHHQQEVRIAWIPKTSGPIEPIFISSKELASCCREVTF